MGQVGGGEHLRGCTVEVRGRPVIFRIFKSILVPLMHQEVRMLLVHLAPLDHTCRVAPGIDLEVVAFLRKEVGLEDQTAARHIHILGNHPLQMLLQHIRIMDVALDHVHIINCAHIHVGEHAAYLLIGMKEDAFIARLGLTVHRLLCDQIDHDHDDRGDHDQHRHNPDAQPVCKSPFLHDHKVLSLSSPKHLERNQLQI